MSKKTGKVTWFTFKQVITSNWFCFITVLGLVCVFLSTQMDKILGTLFGASADAEGQTDVALSVGEATYFLQLAIVIVLFLLIVIYGSNIANSIVEEKSGRIIETLLCYVKPLELLVGKVSGYLLGIFVQLGVWVGYYLILDSLLEIPENQIIAVLGELHIQVLVLLVASVVLGFMMYAFAFAALSSYADNAQDSTQLMLPVVFVIMIAYFVSLAEICGMGGAWIDIISWAPFFSPIVTFVTADLVNLTWGQTALIVGVQLMEVIAVALICARFYRRGVVSYGIRKLSIGKLRKTK